MSTWDSSTSNEWARLKTSIELLIDKATKDNIPIIAVELLRLNLYKGKFFFVKKIMKSGKRHNKPAWILASIVSVINSKIPDIGLILINKMIVEFKNDYVSNKPIMIGLLCELVNYKVLNSLIVLEILELLMTNITNDSIALTITILKFNGAIMPANVLYPIIDKLRNLVSDGELNDYNIREINKLIEIRKRGFKSFTRLLVKEEHCHEFDLEDEFDPYSDETVKDTPEYPDFASEVAKQMGLTTDQDEDENAEEIHDDEDIEPVVDMTQSELISLQKTVYLTIMSSLSSEEAVHKLLKLNYKPEILSSIIIKSCTQEKTYSKYYGTICELLILKSPTYRKEFTGLFESNYETIHQIELNGIRNFGKLYGYLIATEKLPISVLLCVKLTELETNSSNRILIKFLLKEMVEEIGTPNFKELFLANMEELPGLFQTHGEYEDLIFAINYFTAIGLGMLTDSMRSELDTRQRGRKRTRRGSDSSGSYSRSGSSDTSGSYSRSPSRSLSYSRSRSRSP